jgi:tRNA threonylcarbamoyl adenosine modification protein YeaZ
MKTLILDTSSEKNYLIWKESYYPLPGGPDLSRQLASKVKEILDQEVPEEIAVGTGPGSYTGIRVGVAFAKALSYGWKIPLLGFCSLNAFAPKIDGEFVLLTDARAGGFYALFGKREDGVIQYKTPLLIPPTTSPLPAIFSPQTELIQKRTEFPVTPIEVDPGHLSSLIKQQFTERGAQAFELSYLSCP